MKSLYLLILLAISFSINAQTSSIKINPGIVLPNDSLVSEALLFSVNSFISSIQDTSQNEWILPSERMATQLLVDELVDIQKSEKFQSDSFYTAYLTKITPLENKKYAVHIAYIGIDRHSAILRASFELIANKNKDVYLISSPLSRNTQNWQTKKFDNQIYHYPYSLDTEEIQRIYDLTSSFDRKLKNTAGEEHYYLCNDEIDPLKLFGVEYKSDYNGDGLNSIWETSLKGKNLFAMNATRFYNYPEHDLWHFRLSEVISRKKVHKRVDCHIAYLYGGSWGFSWEELFPLFAEKFVLGKDVDWLGHKKTSSHFKTDGRRNYTDDFIGALIVKKIEEERGFEGVWELLMTKRTKDEAEYFAALEKLLGIDKENYNKEVFKLIEEEMARQGIEFIDQ